MSATTRNYARAMSIFALCSSLAFADPADAPTKLDMVPMTTAEATACLTCAADLRDEKASNTKWLIISLAVGVVAGAAIGFGAGYAAGKK